MSLELLKKQLEGLEGDARSTARQAGAGALPLLLETLGDAAFEKRALAVECLAEVGGPKAWQGIGTALGDENPSVRNAALAALRAGPDPSVVPRLLELVVRSEHPEVRGAAARTLGTMKAPDAAGAIQAQSAREADPDAAADMEAALARLVDGEARRRILVRLGDPSPKVRYRMAAEVEYIGEPSLLARLEPLLKDEAPVRNLGVEQFPVWHRVCDRAVETIAAISGKPLTFRTGGRTYTAFEIREAAGAIPKGS